MDNDPCEEWRRRLEIAHKDLAELRKWDARRPEAQGAVLDAILWRGDADTIMNIYSLALRLSKGGTPLKLSI